LDVPYSGEQPEIDEDRN
jgi:hypothetical protein